MRFRDANPRKVETLSLKTNTTTFIGNVVI